MKLNDPQSWSLPTETVEVDDPKLGRVRVTRWSESHFRQSAQRPMEMIRVEVLESRDGKRRFAPLWLAWLGETIPPLETLWLTYLRRFAIEDAFHLVKRLLGLAYLWTGSLNGIKLQIWATWLMYAVLVDLSDAVAEAVQLPSNGSRWKWFGEVSIISTMLTIPVKQPILLPIWLPLKTVTSA